MWTVIAAGFSWLLSFFFSKKTDADKEQRQTINESSRTSSEISRETAENNDHETTAAQTQSDADLKRMSAAGSVSERTDIINEAIRRANGKTGS